MTVDSSSASNSNSSETSLCNVVAQKVPVFNMKAEEISGLSYGKKVLDHLNCLAVAQENSHPLVLVDLGMTETLKNWDDRVLKYLLVNSTSKLMHGQAIELFNRAKVYHTVDAIDQKTLCKYHYAFPARSAPFVPEVAFEFVERLVMKTFFPHSIYC
ncbi:hypothetical protein JCM5350_001608 [Sporobolomyces pararoseus]